MPVDITTFATRTPLTNASLKFYNKDSAYLYPHLFPDKQVDKTLTAIFQYDDQVLRLYETRAKTDAEAPLVDWGTFKTSITLEEHKLKAKINPHDAANADPAIADFDTDALQSVMAGIMLRKEALAASIATASGNYPSASTSALAAGVRWGDPGGDPEANKVTADNALMAQCGQPANALAISDLTWRALKTSPSFRSRVQYTQAFGKVTPEAVMAFFDIDYLFIGSTRYQSTRLGGATNVTTFWSDNAIFFVFNPSIGLRDMAYGASYLRNKMVTRTFIDEKRGGVDGIMKFLETALEYKLAAGFVDASGSTKFGAGYLFRTVY